MRKIQMILAGVFLGGVVLGGIGTGIALVEYSSLSYGGQYLIGEENLVTKNFDYEFEPEGNIIGINDKVYLNGIRVEEIGTDDMVPAGVVRYEVTYNEKLVTPFLRFDKNEEEEVRPQEEIIPEEPAEKAPVYLGTLWLAVSYQGSDFGIVMQNKDHFLEELKNKRISDYEVLYITDIKVKVNPKTLACVKLGVNTR